MNMHLGLQVKLYFSVAILRNIDLNSRAVSPRYEANMIRNHRD